MRKDGNTKQECWYCLANVKGNCVAGECRGKVLGFDFDRLSPVTRRNLYERAVQLSQTRGAGETV